MAYPQGRQTYRKSSLQVQKHQFIRQLRDENGDHTPTPSAPLSKEDVANLEEKISGRIVWPWSNTYNQDRQEFDAVYQAFPLLIVFAANYADVRISLQLARECNLHAAIRSGGHSFAGYSVCDGLVIDVSGLNNITVNPFDETA